MKTLSEKLQEALLESKTLDINSMLAKPDMNKRVKNVLLKMRQDREIAEGELNTDMFIMTFEKWMGAKVDYKDPVELISFIQMAQECGWTITNTSNKKNPYIFKA